METLHELAMKVRRRQGQDFRAILVLLQGTHAKVSPFDHLPLQRPRHVLRPQKLDHLIDFVLSLAPRQSCLQHEGGVRGVCVLGGVQV